MRTILKLGLAVVFAVALFAQAAKPISYNGLLEALRIGGLQPAELAQIIKQRGVDFPLTAERESALVAAGAKPEVLAAVRASYRGAAQQQTAPVPVQPKPQAPVWQGDAAAPAPAAKPAPKNIREVRKLFIEKMPSDLDTFIKSEISKQMPTRLLVVLNRDDADAVMAGKGEQTAGGGSKATGGFGGIRDTATGAVSIRDLGGTVELWTSEAGDKTPVVSLVRRGGPKKVAERLVSNLKKAMTSLD